MKAEDAARVKVWRNEFEKDREVIVANTTYRLAPWADCLYAMDRNWWSLHAKEVKATFKGGLYSHSAQEPSLNVKEMRRPEFEHFSNSGAGAVALAIAHGAKTVYLLGYDCQHVHGQSHWHGDHPKPLTNMGSLERWAKFFSRLARHAELRGVTVYNCSRITAMTAFPRKSIDEVLPFADAEAA